MKVYKYIYINRFRIKNFSRFLLLVLFSVSFVIPFWGCTQNNKKVISEICLNTESICEKKNVEILLITNRGNVHLELYGEKAPLTVGNFLDLLERGFYNNTIFHRVINKPIPFLIQGGQPVQKNSNFIKNQYDSVNFVDPNTGEVRYIPLEIKLKSEELPRYNQPIKGKNNLLNIDLKHKRGSISMARSEGINSASSQFYISLQSLPELDGRYAVFGRVVMGMKVISSIKKGDYIIRFERL